MKKIIFYLAGVIFLFISCQSDDLSIDEAAKSDNAYSVTKTFKMLYSMSRSDIVQNSNLYQNKPDTTATGEFLSGCGGVDNDGFFQFQVVGNGIATFFGKFTLINLGCVIMPPGEWPEPLLFHPPYLQGWITTANGDMIYTIQTGGSSDKDNPKFVNLEWTIIGGTGRFENATGWFSIYGDTSADYNKFTGEGEITFDKGKMD